MPAVGVIDHSNTRTDYAPDDHDVVSSHGYHARGGLGRREPEPICCQPQIPDGLAEYLHRRAAATEVNRRTAGRVADDLRRTYIQAMIMPEMMTAAAVRMMGHRMMTAVMFMM